MLAGLWVVAAFLLIKSFECFEADRKLIALYPGGASIFFILVSLSGMSIDVTDHCCVSSTGYLSVSDPASMFGGAGLFFLSAFLFIFFVIKSETEWIKG